MNPGALCLLTLLLMLPPALAAAQPNVAEPGTAVTEQPVSAADEAKLDAYMQDAILNDNEPEVVTAPDYWRPGYTCADIYTYGWMTYRNCRYYLLYYGRYWD